MRSVPLPFLSKITLLWTRAREPGPVSPVKVDSPLPFPWTQRGEIYTQRLSRRQSGIVVVLHSSAADAEKFAMHHDVDIVYVREKLDEMSGQELVRRILRFRPTAECHVLGPEEDIPFAGASCREWDPFETEANEFDSPQEENAIALRLRE